MNALQHGLNAKTLVLANESKDGYHKMLQEYIDTFLPEGTVEMDLVQEMVAAKWRQRRAWAVETATIDLQMHRDLEAVKKEFSAIDEFKRMAIAHQKLCAETRALQHTQLTDARMSRMFDRALKQLIYLQSLRPRNENNQNEPNPTNEHPGEPANPSHPANPIASVGQAVSPADPSDVTAPGPQIEPQRPLGPSGSDCDEVPLTKIRNDTPC